MGLLHHSTRAACRRTLRLGVSASMAGALAGAAILAGTSQPALAGSGVWSTSGPPGGTVNAIAYIPVGSTVYAATENGGVMKSTNGGTAWTFDNGALGNTYSSTALAVQPSSPSTIYQSDEGSLYKTTTGGSSWTSSSTGLTGAVSGIAIDPTTQTTVYAATSDAGIFKSTNSGSTWTAMTTGLPRNGQFNVVRVDPVNHLIVYAAGLHGIYRSTNGGTTWTADHNGIPYSDGVNDIAVDPNADATLLAATDGGTYLSTNSGASWTMKDPNPTTSVVFTPNAPATDYAGVAFGGVIKSTTTGSTWASSSGGLPSTFSATQAIAVDPASTSTVLAGLSYPAGIYKTTTGGGTATTSWKAASGGINQIQVGAVAGLTSTTFLAAASGTTAAVYKGTIGSTGAVTYTSSGSGLNGLAPQAFQVINASKVYALSYAGLFVSINGGTSWSLVANSDTLGAVAFAVDQTNNSHIDIVTYNGTIAETTNGGSTWPQKTPSCFPLNTEAFSPQSFAMQPNNGLHSALTTNNGVFFTTNDWTTCAKAAGTSSGQYGAGAAFDPANPTTLWVYGAGAGKATFPSSGSMTFSAVSALSADEVSLLVFNPAKSGNILATVNGASVVQSFNGGSTFPAVTSSGLVASDLTSLTKAGTTVVLGTAGNSVATNTLTQ